MSGLEHSTIPLEEFDTKLRPFLTEVSSSSLGGKVLSCSDDFFASKDNLIKPYASVSMKGQFGPTGALYDGWESRRHNPNFDWVIIRLATPLTSLSHVDIDTSHFSGNECPASQVFALRLTDKEIANENLKLSTKDGRWEQVLEEVTLGPNSRHIFKLGSKATGGVWSAVLVRMIPDGGMARFRAYGSPQSPALLDVLPEPSVKPINLLSPLRSARIVACSDANFSPPGNLLLPGRGIDMSDGWETRRSQVNKGKYAPGAPLHGQERREWVVARLAGTGAISYVEVDTAYHPGNYPVACKVEAILSENELPGDDEEWTTIVEKKPLGAHRQHWFDRERNVASNAVFSHVRLSIYPDGGLKRLRIYGHPLKSQPLSFPSIPVIPALPLTPETFAPYGQVIQGFSLHSSAPKGKDVTVANQGTAFKFHRMGNVSETYQPGALVRGGPYIGVTRAKKRLDISEGTAVTVTTLERHRHTNQAFIPMGKGVSPGVQALGSGGAYLAVAALNGPDDKPDMSTARAFLGTAAQGISYNMGVWHHSLVNVDGDLDYALVEAQIGDWSVLDCEKHTPETPYAIVQIDPYTAVQATSATTSPGKPIANGHSAFSKLNGFVSSLPSLSTSGPVVPVPITRENFAPFGQVLQAYPDEKTRWEGQDIQVAPDGMATKYARLADITSTYPSDADAVTGISVFRATPKVGLERGKAFDLRYMERHSFTSQAFIPMAKAEWQGKGEEKLEEGGEVLVVVAKNGEDDRPDPKTIQAFICPSSMGFSYNVGVWHHPSLVLDQTLDLACVETQISTGVPEADERDCELVSWEQGEAFGQVQVPLH